MSQRRSDPTKWVWCVLVLSSGPAWSSASSVGVTDAEKIPSTIEAQAKFFQDFFSVQLSPYKIEFGHVCEDPDTWEQRYEKKDFKNHRDMGKVQWGDRKGGYGEHYWDLNHAIHAGHAVNQEDDDDYDDASEELQDYSESLEQSNKDGIEEYDSDASDYEKSSRPKRENSKVEYKLIQKRSNNDATKINSHIDSQGDVDIDNRHRVVYKFSEGIPESLFAGHNVKDYHENSKYKYLVPYEVSGSERGHNQHVAATVMPRLVFEPITGHVIDKATGKTYVLQPVHVNNKYS